MSVSAEELLERTRKHKFAVVEVDRAEPATLPGGVVK
jgi:hypothetical protein